MTGSPYYYRDPGSPFPRGPQNFMTPGPNLRARLGKPCPEDPGPEKCESAKCSVNMRARAGPAPDSSPHPSVNAACFLIPRGGLFSRWEPPILPVEWGQGAPIWGGHFTLTPGIYATR